MINEKEKKTHLQNSVGIVQPQQVELSGPDNSGIELECGARLDAVTVQYEAYGKLNERRDNTILLCHALSGDAHAAGYHSIEDDKPGWWDEMVGPGKGFDTERYFIICSNVLGGCKGTTGPSTIDPATGKPYGTNFPIVTVPDMVNVQKLLLDHLGIDKLLAVSGGSMGGMQALQWAVSYPDVVQSVIPIATTPRLSQIGRASCRERVYTKV